MDTHRDRLYLPGGGVVMAVWFTFALMLAVVANVIAAAWIAGH